MNVSLAPDRCTVIVTVDAPAEALSVVEAHARLGLERFHDYPGYLGGALHLSRDRTRLVQYLQWRTEAEYQACIEDARWQEEPSALRVQELVANGTATMHVGQYTVAALSPGD